MRTVVIIAGCQSYRTGDFLAAASLLRLTSVIASDVAAPLGADALASTGAGHIEIELHDAVGAADRIVAAVPDAAAVVAVDDEGVETAALAAQALGLAHNPPDAVAATRDKLTMRRLLAAAGVEQPGFAAATEGAVPTVAAQLGYPVVVKPVGLSASRGVIRVDGAIDSARAERRIRAILGAAGRDPSEPLLVEEYVPGVEVVVEGLLLDGDLTVLAVIDKPDALIGPFFEETMFVTPSRLSKRHQEMAVAIAGDAARALGLLVGPIHAEVRISPDGAAKLIEIAARSIGGLCGRSLTFGLLGESLEVVILRSALGISSPDTDPGRPATGVLMLPIPASGTLTGVESIRTVQALPGIDAVTITVPLGSAVRALPEGDRYLGFVFASGGTADEVETALRRAATTLIVTIDGEHVESRSNAADHSRTPTGSRRRVR